MRIRRFGEHAWLVDSTQPLELAQYLSDRGLIDVVPSAHEVLVHGPDDEVIPILKAAPQTFEPRAWGEALRIQATWDGPDLEEVAHRAAMTTGELVTLLESTTLLVAFCGFAPGFGYMTGLPQALNIPRRPNPRTTVAAGSIAIAAGYCAIYPQSSPGGWHLLGTSSTALFDPDDEEPALLTPGTRVRFVP